MSLKKSISLLILITLGGTFATFVIAFAYYEGWFIQWEYLGRPPEKAIKLVAITNGLRVETASGQVYQYAGDRQCGDNCWNLSDNSEPDPPPYLSIEMCGWYPSLPASIDTKAVCRPWGPGGYLTVYAIRNDGSIFSWEHGLGEGGSIIWAPILAIVYGTPASFFVALIIVASRRPQSHEKTN
jgi:hypothetical protein